MDSPAVRIVTVTAAWKQYDNVTTAITRRFYNLYFKVLSIDQPRGLVVSVSDY
jgi:hypothetical protein